MKIAVCQMNIIQGDKQKNKSTAETCIEKAAGNGAKVIVLPEMWTCGYDFAKLTEHTEQLDGPTSQFLSHKAKQYGVYIVGGSLPIQSDAGVCNTSLTFAPTGERLHVYSKMHLIGLMDEDKYLVPGKDYNTFKIDGAPAATIICYDLRFPELIRSYALEGARVVFVPAEWPEQREQHWLTLLRARAIENQIFVIGANISGVNENDIFNGHSIIYDPWGEVVAEAGKEPTILYAELDLESVPTIRERMPVFKDRVPSLYRL